MYMYTCDKKASSCMCTNGCRSLEAHQLKMCQLDKKKTHRFLFLIPLRCDWISGWKWVIREYEAVFDCTQPGANSVCEGETFDFCVLLQWCIWSIEYLCICDCLIIAVLYTLHNCCSYSFVFCFPKVHRSDSACLLLFKLNIFTN